MFWNVKCKCDEGNSPELNGGSSLSRARTADDILHSILISRGIKEEDFESFLNPLNCPLGSPDIFTDIDKAKKRVFKAIENKELILIWGDFDCDGVTSSAIMYKTLKALGANFDYIIPDRDKMGHGLNSKVLLPYIAKNKPKVVITVDCGISNVKEIALLKGFKVDVILTDHHKAPEILPEAYAILNPKAENSLRGDLSVKEIEAVGELCGAGVAYKFATALLEDIDNEALKNEILALSAVGTIADVVPLIGENRLIAAHGLKLINQGAHKAISRLFKECEKNGEITSYDAAFILVPRINAAGRLATAEPAFKLLVDEDEQTIENCIYELENYNKVRQSLSEDIYAKALDMINADKNFKKQKAIVLFNEGWHIGVIGIVASKIVEKFYKPVFMVTKDDSNQARCSIRGIDEYNIMEILDENAKYFTGYGGHKLAGGFSFDLNQYSFDTVKNAILESFEAKQDVKIMGQKLDIDAVLDGDEINEDLICNLQKLEPTGQANPSPVFAVKNAELMAKKLMGKEKNHLSFKIKKDDTALECVWWRKTDIPVLEGENFDLAFEAKINEFRNEKSVRLYAIDIQSEKIAKNDGFRGKFYDHRKKTGILPQINEYVQRGNVDISVFAKTIDTKKTLAEFGGITSKIPSDGNFSTDDIMFFDYPPEISEFKEIIQNGNYSKIHLMKENFETNIEGALKLLIGMLKFSTNNREGEISVRNLAENIGVTENFVQTCLDILEDIGSVEIMDVDRVNFIAPPHLDSFYKNPDFETLKDEFDTILNFKNYIAQADLSDIENLFKD